MKSRNILCLALVPMALGAQEARDLVMLKNWSNPLYWRASQAEREAISAPVPQLQFSPTQVSADALRKLCGASRLAAFSIPEVLPPASAAALRTTRPSQRPAR